MVEADSRQERRGRRRSRSAAPRAQRVTDYHNLRNPFPPMAVFSDDRIEAIHDAALKLLQELGIKVLLPEARDLFRAGGASVDETSEMVCIGREMIEAALESAPKSFVIHAGRQEKDILLAPGQLVFQSGAGAPHATDRERGRRPGTLNDFCEFVRLTEHFDVLQMVPPVVEPQDVPIHLRHYETALAQLTLSTKVPFVFSRGTPQVTESFEMIRDFRGLSDAEFHASSHCYTIINTNSPRQIDIPMAQGLIDFARAGQVSIVTPFTLMGAMAPITVAGAITLSHAEALAAIALTQLVKPGAPVSYGTFTSNVDMKSGAPAFGTPEHFRASLAAGQLARKIGLPWRSATGSAANINDAQAANETQLGLWGCLLAGSTIVIHAAGWLEGGLTVSFEKFVTDCEVLQMVAELCSEAQAGDDEIALEALSEVQPGGHFFGATHTMERYQTEFYEPFLHSWANFGTWTERGAKDADQRATEVWREILATSPNPEVDPSRAEALQNYIEARAEAGGAPPES
ncbi:trimethylamine methyltransferase family protein [Pelagibius sp. Alg239-R121]|uniref:trimethylamine methyltransferase family protein n=1 Tax=Pelagibius sp. Alg239-R121 TaxID=2993448 RepID=UPI0024A66BE0|nr:trimethylamine methyltransferase family protein [Pelagibius sp. Alg239-R121]